MAVNMKNVSSGMWHFTVINYLCHLGVRVPMKRRQKVSLKCGSFSTRLYYIASLKPILFMEFVCVCVCVCMRAACGERLCEEKTMPLLHEAVVGAHMRL